MNRGECMGEAVVCTEAEFRKAAAVFPVEGSSYRWSVVPADEERVAGAVSATRSRVAVVGTARYHGPLYEALAGSAESGSALIVRYGVGYDGIDMEECRKLNIVVANTPGVLDASVAEHTIALLLSLARHVPSLDAATHRGGFQACTGTELEGKTLGVAGFGAIGRRVALAARRGLGMRVIAFDALSGGALGARESLSERDFLDRYGLEECTTDFSGFAPRLDALAIHLPATAVTLRYLDAIRLGMLPPGALVVNTSRGCILDEEALFRLLSSGRLAGAALDVFAEEPYRPSHPACDLRSLANVVLTPHVASDTVEANRRIQAAVLRNIHWFLAGDFRKITRVD